MAVYDPVMARFCYDMQIGRVQFRRLCDRAGKAAEWGAATVDPDDNAGKMVAEFERYAGNLGFTVIWPGLYPMITKNGRSVTISEDGIS